MMKLPLLLIWLCAAASVTMSTSALAATVADPTVWKVVDTATTTSPRGLDPNDAPVNAVSGFVPQSVYTCSRKLPLVGRQSFRLEILDDTTATFVVSGAISLQDTLPYTLCPTTGRLTLYPQSKTSRILKSFGLRMGQAQYDVPSDVASLQVVSKWGLPSVQLQFHREQPLSW